MFDGSKTQLIKDNGTKRLKCTENAIMRCMWTVVRDNPISEEWRSKPKTSSISEVMRAGTLEWCGHMDRSNGRQSAGR